MEYWTCKSNTGEKRISPEPTIYEDDYWLVEHAYPVKIIGWLVIVLKRHIEALNELTTQAKAVDLLNQELHGEKEYISCYAEQEHFRPIHFHVFSKPFDLSDEIRGGKSFVLLKVTAEEAIPDHKIIAFCKLLRDRFIRVSWI